MILGQVLGLTENQPFDVIQHHLVHNHLDQTTDYSREYYSMVYHGAKKFKNYFLKPKAMIVSGVFHYFHWCFKW